MINQNFVRPNSELTGLNPDDYALVFKGSDDKNYCFVPDDVIRPDGTLEATENMLMISMITWLQFGDGDLADAARQVFRGVLELFSIQNKPEN